jgi:hypothetical protein
MKETFMSTLAVKLAVLLALALPALALAVSLTARYLLCCSHWLCW